LHGAGAWSKSTRKGEEAPASPKVVAPGLGGSARAARFFMADYAHPANEGAEHAFAAVSGRAVTVEMTVKPSSEERCLTVAVRHGRNAAAYIRFNGRRAGWAQQYDHTGQYRDIAPYLVDGENRLRIELDTTRGKLRAWVNGLGGQEWDFRAKAPAIDRIDLFMTHGRRGQQTWSVVDDIVVRNDKAEVAFAESFEHHFPRDGDGTSAPTGSEILLADNFDTYQPGELVGQGGWARSEDFEEAPGHAQVIAPGLDGKGAALGLTAQGQGASKAFSRNVGAEGIAVEFAFRPGTRKRPLTLGLRSGPVGDGVRGQASAYLKLDGGKFYLLKKEPQKWTPFDGVGWTVGQPVRVRLLVDYVANRARIEVNGVQSPTVIGDWWTTAKPGNIDITCQFGAGGSTLDHLVVRTIPTPARVGVLRQGPQAGHYLHWKGRPILPIGDSVTQGWMEGGTNFDQKAYLDALAGRGINAVLLWSYRATSAPRQRGDPRVGYDAPESWPWKGSPDDRSFDLTAFHQPYFDRLREFVKYAESKDILVILTVQDGWPKQDGFADHPFNAALGNGPLTANRQFVELADYDKELPAVYDPRWTWQRKNQFFQERFADKLCSELKDCPNVIFEMFNEGEWYDPELRRRHEEHFLRFFRTRTDAPLATNFDHIRSKRYEPRKLAEADILSVHSRWTGYAARLEKEFQAEPARVLVETEPVPSLGGLEPAQKGRPLITLAVLQATVWERALTGTGFVAQNDTSFGWDPRMAMAKHAQFRDQAYDVLGHAARFFNQSGVTFWEMAPASHLSSTRLCLARPGVEYVVYAPEGGAFTVDLSAAKGKQLAVRWYDPRKGAFQAGDRIGGGADAQAFTPPFSGDAVLHLQTTGT
jgi:hypothetical protein